MSRNGNNNPFKSSSDEEKEKHFNSGILIGVVDAKSEAKNPKVYHNNRKYFMKPELAQNPLAGASNIRDQSEEINKPNSNNKTPYYKRRANSNSGRNSQTNIENNTDNQFIGATDTKLENRAIINNLRKHPDANENRIKKHFIKHSNDEEDKSFLLNKFMSNSSNETAGASKISYQSELNNNEFASSFSRIDINNSPFKKREGFNFQVRKRDNSCSSFQSSNNIDNEDNQSIATTKTEDESNEFLLNTYGEFRKILNKRMLEYFIETENEKLLEEFHNDITNIIRRRYELDSKTKHRLRETNDADEERKALECEIKLAERNIQSIMAEMDRLKSTNQKYLTTLYNAYEREFDRAKRKLPFYAYRAEIIDKLKANDVLVIIGQTGSGKTTQGKFYYFETIFIFKHEFQVFI